VTNSLPRPVAAVAIDMLRKTEVAASDVVHRIHEDARTMTQEELRQ
jgi:hypothetical protein